MESSGQLFSSSFKSSYWMVKMLVVMNKESKNKSILKSIIVSLDSKKSGYRDDIPSFETDDL